MLFSIVEWSGSIAWRRMLVPPHSGEITPTIKEAPVGVQLGGAARYLRDFIRGRSLSILNDPEVAT